MTETTAQGLVLTRAKQGVLVRDDSGTQHWCRVPGKGKRMGMPVPGDYVDFKPSTTTKDGFIEAIHDRSSFLERYSYGRKKEIAANIEQLFLLTTIREPVVSPRLVDRMLVGASIGNMNTTIVLNKTDLFSEDEIERYLAPWRNVYPIHAISAMSGEGLAELESQLRGKVSMLAGASGVGKSTVLNALISDLDLDTSAISAATDRGVHTTTATFLYPLPSGGTVADTPGIREFFPVIDDVKTLALHFPEFAEYQDQCRFDDCLHLENSAGCAVRDAANSGAIHPDRYTSYLLLRESLIDGPRRGRKEEAPPPVF
ncbi:ribosome small subunit-dependent GTPase A [bacterium]|nr:ribosome small subunit-dependent GTPase A [bacterium]